MNHGVSNLKAGHTAKHPVLAWLLSVRSDVMRLDNVHDFNRIRQCPGLETAPWGKATPVGKVGLRKRVSSGKMATLSADTDVNRASSTSFNPSDAHQVGTKETQAASSRRKSKNGVRARPLRVEARLAQALNP